MGSVAEERRPAMAGEIVTTVVGNLTADPELRYTASGDAVASFTIASTPRYYDRAAGKWTDGDVLFLRCSVWKAAAENTAETLQRGMRIVACGRLQQRSYQTAAGDKRTVIELAVDEIGPALRYATAKVTRTRRATESASDREDVWGTPWASEPAPVG